MDWSRHLEPGEEVRWEGRPAPTCFTFRNWRHSLFGSLLLVMSVYWLLVGVQLRAIYGHWLLSSVPVPFILAGLYLSIGHILHARLEWEKVFYGVTDRRVLVRRGFFRPRLETLRLAELSHFRMKPLAEELASFRLNGGTPTRSLALCCIEHPRRLTALLESALAEQQRLEMPGRPATAAEHRD